MLRDGLEDARASKSSLDTALFPSPWGSPLKVRSSGNSPSGSVRLFTSSGVIGSVPILHKFWNGLVLLLLFVAAVLVLLTVVEF